MTDADNLRRRIDRAKAFRRVDDQRIKFEAIASELRRKLQRVSAKPQRGPALSI
jgi:hypothetical protein